MPPSNPTAHLTGHPANQLYEKKAKKLVLSIQCNGSYLIVRTKRELHFGSALHCVQVILITFSF